QLARSLTWLAHLDSIVARALFARRSDARSAPVVAAPAPFRIERGRHPLLVVQGGEVVPFDLEFEHGEFTLLISGPNTGGKTALRKGVALLSAMIQSGIPAPVGPASLVPVFRDFFADIGDEQSIQASLSTFSAHLRNINTILHSA